MKPKPKKTKPTVSQSTVQTYAQCPERLRRILNGDSQTPFLSWVRGTAVHKAAEFGRKLQMAGKAIPSINDVMAVIATTYDKTVKAEGYTLTPDEVSQGSKKAIGVTKDEAVRLGPILQSKVRPLYKPIAVEKEVYIELPESSHDLRGRIDMVADGYILEEVKTSRGLKQAAEFHGSFQLSLYSLFHRAVYGREPYEIKIDNIVARPSGTVELQQLRTTRTFKDHESTVKRLNDTVKAIDAGIFPARTNPGMFPCGPKWCPFWSTCPAISPTTRSLVQ